MKHLTVIIFTLCIVYIIACGNNSETIPEDLEGKKTYLEEKKSELRDLTILIENLDEEINALSPEKEKDPILINSIQLEPQEFKRYIEVQANVLADDVVNVSSDIGGRLIRVNVKEGQYVKKGQLIAVTDMQTYENQIEEITKSLELANIVFERQKRLWDQNIGSEIQFLEAKNNKERLEKSIKTVNSQIDKKNIYAPISGVVDIEFLKSGEIAQPGMPIVQLMDPSKIKIEAEVQESLLGKIKKGDIVDIYFPTLDKSLNEKISMIGRTIDVSNRTFKIEINTDSNNEMLKPNLLAKIRLNDYSESEALVLPLEALREGVDSRKYVFIVNEKEKPFRAQKVYISLGESTDGFAVVKEGLKNGDRVIIAGTSALSDNDPVVESNTSNQ